MLRTGTAFLSALTLLTPVIICATMAAHAGNPAVPVTEVQRIPASDQGGQAFRLTYTVHVPLDVFWKFKTDFTGNFMSTNRYILSNRLVSRQNNVYITETRYASAPQTLFRWQTTVFPASHRMDYRLVNPKECGQNFNRGSIQLSSESGNTRVVHSSYFDFFGATVWAHYPGPGGMVIFLRYTADWERETIEKLKHRYLP